MADDVERINSFPIHPQRGNSCSRKQKTHIIEVDVLVPGFIKSNIFNTLLKGAQIKHFRIAIGVGGITCTGVGGGHKLCNKDRLVRLNIITSIAGKFIVEIIDQPGHHCSISFHNSGRILHNYPVNV